METVQGGVEVFGFLVWSLGGGGGGLGAFEAHLAPRILRAISKGKRECGVQCLWGLVRRFRCRSPLLRQRSTLNPKPETVSPQPQTLNLNL